LVDAIVIRRRNPDLLSRLERLVALEPVGLEDEYRLRTIPVIIGRDRFRRIPGLGRINDHLGRRRRRDSQHHQRRSDGIHFFASSIRSVETAPRLIFTFRFSILKNGFLNSILCSPSGMESALLNGVVSAYFPST